MTENKQFVNIKDEIHINGEWWCSANGEHCADVITTALNELLDENEQLKKQNDNLVNMIARVQYRADLIKEENEQLKQENQRMTDKLNQLALEFLNYDMVTMGKATEISEMCYYDFLKYRKENGNPMEL